MVYVLLLLAEELSTHSIESVASELVITLNNLKNIHLEATIDVHCLGVPLTKRLGGEMSVTHF
jgi:hypothetical protein